MSVASAFDRAPALQELPILPRTINDRTITDLVCAPLMGPAGRRWWIAFLICSAGTLVTLYGVYTPFTEGIGIFGNNTSVVWGFPIANYVWWIGLGNAGTLISSLLVLTRQSWRATVSRFAEAMTLFAVPIAGLFPIFHLGRPLYFYWLAPYPDTMRIWPQWRSALVWDFWAIVSYLIVSIVFWYVGVLPDLATVRDRSTGAWQKIYGVAALGWRGSARHWRHYHRLQITLAALATPLVCSVHSVVGLDFAESLMPGWREPISRLFRRRRHVFGLRAGCPARRNHHARLRASGAHHLAPLRSQDHADGVDRHGPLLSQRIFRCMVRSNPADRDLVKFEFTGAYRKLYAGMLFCNVVAPQILWSPRMRASLAVIRSSHIPTRMANDTPMIAMTRKPRRSPRLATSTRFAPSPASRPAPGESRHDRRSNQRFTWRCTSRPIARTLVDVARQREAATLGMWLFLMSEMLFFGAIFLAFSLTRSVNVAEFQAAARETEIGYGAANTAVLVTSSLTMTLAVRATKNGDRNLAARLLAATAVLGALFLVIKGFEYRDDLKRHLYPAFDFALGETAAQIFWAFYWIMTGLHAVHLAVGIGLVSRLTWLTRRRRLSLESPQLEVTSLYWHLVDAFWIVLFSVLYIMRRE